MKLSLRHTATILFVSRGIYKVQSDDIAATLDQDAAVTLNSNYTFTGDTQFNGNVGFFGHAPHSKPTITGSRDTNPALRDLLSALESLGLITDNTTEGSCCYEPPGP